VTSTVNEVCRRLKSEEKPTVMSSRLVPHSVHAVKNGRRKMEDRHVIVHDVNVIYSGHANQVFLSDYSNGLAYCRVTGQICAIGVNTSLRV